MKKLLYKVLAYLGITSHYLHVFFKYVGIAYVIFFCYAVYTETQINPHYRTTPYVYSTRELTIGQMSEILSSNRDKYGITSICKPYKPDLIGSPISYKKCRWHSARRCEFIMKVSNYRICYAIIECRDSLEIFPLNVTYIGNDDPYKDFPELNEDLRMLLYHRSIVACGEERLQSILPDMRKTCFFPFHTDLWYLLFSVRPHKLCFFLHFMLIGNFIIMGLLKWIEKLSIKLSGKVHAHGCT